MAERSNLANQRVGDAFLGQLCALSEASSNSLTNLSQLVSLAVDTVETLASPTPSVPHTLDEHLRQRALNFPEQREQSESLAANSTAASLERQLSLLLDEITAALASTDLPNTVNSNYGPVRLVDYLRGHCIVLAGLAFRITGTPTQPVTAEAVRSLASVIVERQPGRTIELRVPPLTAIQLGAAGDGSVHTRGTPPNVVEMNPRIFLTMATGTTNWDDAYSAGELSVSGAHAADVADLLPVVDLSY